MKRIMVCRHGESVPSAPVPVSLAGNHEIDGWPPQWDPRRLEQQLAVALGLRSTGPLWLSRAGSTPQRIDRLSDADRMELVLGMVLELDVLLVADGGSVAQPNVAAGRTGDQVVTVPGLQTASQQSHHHTHQFFQLPADPLAAYPNYDAELAEDVREARALAGLDAQGWDAAAAAAKADVDAVAAGRAGRYDRDRSQKRDSRHPKRDRHHPGARAAVQIRGRRGSPEAPDPQSPALLAELALFCDAEAVVGPPPYDGAVLPALDAPPVPRPSSDQPNSLPTVAYTLALSPLFLFSRSRSARATPLGRRHLAAAGGTRIPRNVTRAART